MKRFFLSLNNSKNQACNVMEGDSILRSVKFKMSVLYPQGKLKSLFVIGFSLCFMIGTIAVSDAAPKKRIAVLYFEDHSRFDSPTGCGCVPTFIGKHNQHKETMGFGGGICQNAQSETRRNECV